LAMLTNQIVSHLWERPRPFVTHHALHLLSAPSADPSFPSDHAAAAFAIAFAVLALWRRAGVLFLVAAALIATSRVALGMHYPSDVAAGMVVGWLSATVVVRYACRPVGRMVDLASRFTDPIAGRAGRRLASLARR
jgi:undecaprenyl-diphosphatase